MSLVDDDRLGAGRVAGAALAVTLATIAIKQIGAQAVTGQTKISSHWTAAQVMAHWAHPDLRWLFWQAAAGIVAALVFFVGFRHRILRDHPAGTLTVLADVAVVLGAAEMVLLLIEVALQLAMVDLATSPATSAAGGILGIFRTWDWVYNSMVFWLEAPLVGLLATLAWRSGITSRAWASLGYVAAGCLALNTLVLPMRLSAALSAPGIVLFVAWAIGLSVRLLLDRPNPIRSRVTGDAHRTTIEPVAP